MIKINDKVKIIAANYYNSIGVVLGIEDMGEYRNIDVEFIDDSGIGNSDIFHDCELMNATIN